jgi:hypothetical protein
MVWVDGKGNPERIYAYTDNVGIDGLYLSSWEVMSNPLFLHCPADQLQDTFTIITATCVL